MRKSIGRFLATFISFLFFSTHLFAQTNDSAVRIKWGYKGNIGPERWWQLDPNFILCAHGKSQSPINIKTKVKSIPHTLVLHYQPTKLVIIDDGNTELMLGKTQTIINDGHSVQLNFPNTPKETISFNGKEYQLLQLHFHSPSENQWNGRSFPLEIHFVHQGKEGKLAVIGVFVKGGKASKAIDKIIQNLPKEEGKEMIIQTESINPNHLMPAKLNYYYFMGSLTTPPCTEDVEWIVMAEPITASPAQIATLRRASLGGNARPVQKIFNREVSYTRNE